MIPTAPSTPRPSDKWIPYLLSLGFVALILPLAPMMYMAIHTMPGVVTANAYEKGIAYNKAIANGAQENALSWHGDVAIDAPTGQPASISYVLRDAAEQGIDDATVHVWLVRPVQGGMDRDLAMQGQGGGRYTTSLDLPARGVWDIRVSATRQQQNFQTDKRVVLP